MNKQYDFSQSGGFPISQNVMDYIQESYSEALGGMSKMIGHLTIVSGDPTKSGWIYLVIDGVGEILPFVGNIKANVFSVKETTEGLLFQNNERKQVKITRSVLPGIWNGSPAYSPLNTPPRELGGSIADLWDKLNAIEERIEPIGTLKMWTGDFTTVPTGWRLANTDTPARITDDDVNFAVLWNLFKNAYRPANKPAGSEETFVYLPNLAGRVPVGQGSFTFPEGGNEWYMPGNTGGATTHTLTVAEMPSHSHTTNAPIRQTAKRQQYNDDNWKEAVLTNGNATINATGGGLAHNNMQPYQVINYIIKVK